MTEYAYPFRVIGAVVDMLVSAIEAVDGSVVDSSGEQYSLAVKDLLERIAFGIKANGDTQIGGMAVETRTVDGIGWAVVDLFDRLSIQVNDDGSVTILGLTISLEEVPGYSVLLIDNDRRIMAGLDENGEQITTTPEPTSTAVTTIDLSTYSLTDYNQATSYGQSVSKGVDSTPPLSTSQPYANLTFIGGVVSTAAEIASDLESSKALVEETKTDGAITFAESPVSGMLNEIVQLIDDEDSIAYGSQEGLWFGSAPGREAAGGFSATMANLAKGSVYYTRLLSHVSAANALALAADKSHSFQFSTLTHGESDTVDGTTRAAYKAGVLQFVADLATDIPLITRQSFSPLLFLTQMASHRVYSVDTNEIALAQWEAALADARVILAGPMYHINYTGGAHPNNEGSRMFGKMLGIAAKRTLVDGVRWRPVEPIAWTWGDTVIDIKFHVPVGPLEIDTTWVSAATNSGFDLWDENDDLLDIIDTVAVVGPAGNRVRIVLDSAAPAGSKLTYARGRPGDATSAGRVTGPRGNLRDNQGDNISYVDGSAVTRRMDNYAVMFEILKD